MPSQNIFFQAAPPEITSPKPLLPEQVVSEQVLPEISPNALDQDPINQSQVNQMRTGLTSIGGPQIHQAQVICTVLANTYPLTPCFLDYTTPFSLLVAVMLSAQSTDRMVNQITPGLRQEADTPAKMLALGYEGLCAHIRRLGLYQQKAQHILKTSQYLQDHHDGQVPRTLEGLVALPGVGRKTANVILNVLYGDPTIPVDTHVFRLARRLGLSQGATPHQVERDLHACVPPDLTGRIHALLITHGRTVCTARRPNCQGCPVRPYCPGAAKTDSPKI